MSEYFTTYTATDTESTAVTWRTATGTWEYPAGITLSGSSEYRRDVNDHSTNRLRDPTGDICLELLGLVIRINNKKENIEIAHQQLGGWIIYDKMHKLFQPHMENPADPYIESPIPIEILEQIYEEASNTPKIKREGRYVLVKKALEWAKTSGKDKRQILYLAA